MKRIFAVAALALIATTASAQNQAAPIKDEYTPAGSQATIVGSDKVFTGTVFVEPIFGRNDVRNFEMASVTFLPGARSNWHTHPRGHTIYVTSGTGWTQVEGQPKRTIRAGDVIWAPPGAKHWHGATDKTAMTHIVVNEYENDSVVAWMERVTDAQYLSN